MRLNRIEKIIFIFSLVFIVYGLIGCFVSLKMFSNIGEHRLDVSADVTTPIENEFKLMAETMNDISITANNSAKTVTSTKEAIITSSEITKQSSDIFFNIADYMDFTVLGWQPLFKTVSFFEEEGTKMTELSVTLDTTVINMNQNIKDLNSLSNNFKKMSANINVIATNINQYLNVNSTYVQMKNYTLLITIWIFSLHLIIIIAGITNILNIYNQKKK